MRSLSWIALSLVLSFLCVTSANSQAAPSAFDGAAGSDTTNLQRLFDTAYRAYEGEQYEQSLSPLERLVEEDVSFVDSARGPAIYWYGRTLERLDRRAEAVTMWRRGLEALDQFSLELADAYVRSVFEEQQTQHYEAASEYYLEMVGYLGQQLSEVEEQILGAHLTELCLILPSEAADTLGLSACTEVVDLSRLPGDTGEQIVSWWSSKNVNFATSRNERLEEHLERVGFARQEYWFGGGYDDRGKTFIRFGPPERHVTIRYDDIRDLYRMPRLAALVGRSFDGSRNEFWVYPQVDRSAHFLFIHERDGAYRLAEAQELIPAGLRSGSRRAPEAVLLMEHVYRQLSLYHIDYATIYEDVALYADELAMARMGTANLSQSPASFVQSALGSARTEDHHIERRRSERLPADATNVHRNTETLELAARPVRFLEDDGTTRVEIYWTTLLNDLHPNRRTRRMLRRAELPGETDGYLIEGTVVTFEEDHAIERKDRRRHRVPAADDVEPTDMIAPLRYTMSMTASPVDIGMQWDQYVIVRNERTDALQRGPKLKVQQMRIDDLEPLSSDPDRLEMSDLVPLWAGREDVAASSEEFRAEHVYPFSEIASDTELALYFEVYHLEAAEDGRRRFSVEYEIARESFASLQGLVLGDREDRSVVRSEYESEGPTAREFLSLDLIDDDFLGTVTITVRVRDDVSGEEVERVLPFSVIDPTRPARRW